ncbi:unnamed protein product [Ceutorhynchus assimilis]|uniref:Uncharacterized protein n=1 Tax=Ceutorhynchus assimilis TaxID=467358 RepID=A0A9N9QMN5_9CUCU|nr:unnamed protein product [Ceutorhynchus assimilis]
MKVAFLLAAVLTVTTCSPNGYYHQEYNYKTSSQSFRNNELQHKTDDQGYYKKDGDLEGRVKPKVSSNSEHSEYINPKLQYGSGASAAYYDADADTASQGNMLANSYGSNYGAGGYHSGYNSEGLASSDYIGGAMSSGSQSVNLRNIASRLQSDLGVELQSALVRPSYQTNIAELEAELHRNLTSRLNEILQERYGSQTIRSGHSYSISGGRVQAAPNYEQSDLDLIQRQVENTLLQELRQQYNRNSQSSHSQQSIHEQSNYDRYVSTTTYRPSTYTYSPNNYDRYAATTTYRPTSYRPIYPNINQVDNQDKYPAYPGGTKSSYYSQSNTNRVTYSQAPHAISITNIASTVQNNLNNQLNRILEQAQTRYFNENSGFSVHNTAPILDNLKQELRQNLTYTLDEELRRQFGTQYQRDGYMFTSGTGGELANQYNYNVADLENLRRQVEENLITKLTRDFEAARQHWITRQQTSSHSQQTYYGQSQNNEHHLGYGTSGNIRYSTPRYPEDEVPRYSTPRYPIDEEGPRYPAVDDYHRPTAASIVPLISSGIKNNHYQAVAGSHVSGYETSGAGGVGVDSSNFARLQQQMQADLSRQLQAALTQTTSSYRASGHTSTSGGRAAFDQAYNQLFDELQRNLTQQLQSYQSGSSSSGYSSSYSGINESQLAQLRSQLQNSLASQLQQGLQQSFSASASYSASSSGSGSYGSSGYRPVRGSDAYQYGQYKSGGNYYGGEDCQGDDPLTPTHQYHRVRRSYGGGYRSRPLGLSTYSGSGYSAGGTYGGHYQTTGSTLGQEVDDSDTLVQSNQHLGQEIDDSEQVVDAGLTYGKQIGQKVDDSDDTQQVEVDNGFSSINLGSNLQGGYQKPSSGYSHHFGVGSQKPKNYGTQLGQEVDDSDTFSSGYQKPSGYSSHHFEVGSQKPKNYGTQLGQEVDDSDTFSGGYQKPLSGYSSHHFEVGSQKPKTYDTQLGQEVDDSDTLLGGYHKPSGFSHESHFEVGLQKPTNSYGSQIGQEGTHFHYGSNSGRYSTESHYTPQSNQKPVYQFGYQKPAYATTQSNSYGTHQLGQEVDNSDDTQQQVEDTDFGQLNVQVPSSTTKYSFGLDGAQYVQTNQKPTPKNVYEIDLDDTQQIEEVGSSSVAPVQPALVSKPIVNRKPLYSETLSGASGYQPKHKYGSQLGQEEDTDDTQQVEVDRGFGFNNQHQQSEFETLNQVSQSTTPKEFVGVNFRPQIDGGFHSTQFGQEVDDTDTMQVPESWAVSTKTTTKNPLVLQYGTPNVLPDSETVKPLQLPTLKTPTYTYHFSRPTTASTLNVMPENENTKPLFGSELVTPKTTTYRYYYSTTTKSPSVVQYGTQNEFGRGDLSPPYQSPSTQVYPEYPQVGLSEPTDSVISRRPFDNPPSPRPEFTPQTYVPPPRPGSQYTGVQPPQPHSHYDYPRQPPRPLFGGLPNPSSSEYPGMAIDVSFSPPPVEVPPIKLKEVTTELQTEFLKEIENIVKNDLPSSNTPKQLYQESLKTLQENITIQCQKLLTDTRYTNLHIYQEDVVILEKYLQYQLTRKLNEKFTTYLRYPIDSQLTGLNTYGRNYGQKPQTSSFLDTEIQHNNQYYPLAQNTPTTTTTLPAPQSSVFQQLPTIPTDNDNLNAAEREADLLIQRIRNTIQNRKNSSVVNQYDSTIVHQPQYKIIQVKLENLTSKQVQIIEDGLENLYEFVNVAVQNQYEKTQTVSIGKNSLYQQSLETLEKDVKIFLSDCIKGNNIDSLKKYNLDKYSSIITNEFDAAKIPDLQKYLEIKLIKKLRAQLKTVYNIQTEEENVEFISQPTVQRVVVKLDKLTPTQYKIINQIEEEIGQQIEASIQTQIESLRQSQVSSYYYQQELNELKIGLENNITETVQKLCEPGFAQYSQLVSDNFDGSKIKDVEKYLQIKLVNKLTESIAYYSSEQSISGSHHISYSSSSSSHHHYSGGYNFGQNKPDGEPLKREENSYQSATPQLANKAIKGGGSQYIEPEAEVVVPESSSLVPDVDTEATTPKPGWWQNFSSKVKSGANKLKDKIVGNA